MVTIVMPVYNEGQYIYQNVMTVRGILADAGIEHEFLLVDDGSRDQSRSCPGWLPTAAM